MDMRNIVRVLPLAAALALSACGGGGSADAGTTSFGSGSGSGTGGSGTGGGTGTGGSGTGGGSGTPTTPGGGISVVANGVPNQRFMSISVKTYNLDWSIDGITTDVQVYVADTAGNPVPDGTRIQFSTEGGQILTSCTTTGITQGGVTISGCSVTFSTQDFRPFDNTVRVIAWMEGDEAYRDVNANGQYDAGEPFVDSGRIFRDDDDDGVYSAVGDELVVGATLAGTPGIGSGACAQAPASVNINEVPLSVANTCDGVWGKTLIRRTVVLPVSDPRSLGIVAVTGGVQVFSGGSSRPVAPPSGTTVSAQNPPAGCTVTVTPATVGNTEVLPTFHGVTGQGSATNPGACSGRSVLIEAKFGNVRPVGTIYTFP
jgi:hypothetical protein